MISYDYQLGLTLEEINALASDGWKVDGVVIHASPSTFDAFLSHGFQDKVLIEDGDKQFYFSQNVSYGEALTITFLTFFFLILITKLIFNFIFQK